MTYPERIKKLREKAFLSQCDLARILHVSNVTVNRWETGKFEPTISSRKALCKLFSKYGIGD
jgi:DNA-binding transcriptional regulator YiaG